jgi:predicted lipoprotein with Yx(FWY)xxD motif
MRPRVNLKLSAFLAMLAFAGSLTAIALASTPSLSIGSASNPSLGRQVLVNTQGRTLYALSPETASHLLCKGACFSSWPPVTVHSRSAKLKAGTGVHGHLALLRRSKGTWQVTLAGHPLYRYSGDQAKGDANGEGIKSFGGTWHAVTASAGNTTMPPPTNTTPTVPTTPSTPYGY